MKITEVGLTALELVAAYPTSLYGGFRNRNLFEDVETYCMFIGYPRSGHSLTGALLDAHPNMVVAHELHTLKYIYAGYSRRQIYHLILENSRTFAEAGRKWGKYSYQVPNQWQGRFKQLRVIGDKKGWGSTLVVQAKPRLIQRLYHTLALNIKFIHVIRNPYDNISTLSLKTKKRKFDLRTGIKHYFSLCQTVMEVKKKIKQADLFELRHEAFIASPKSHLADLCHFLGVEPTDDYLNDCATVVFKSPRRTRDEAPWNGELIELVKQKIDLYPFLHGYSYDD